MLAVPNRQVVCMRHLLLALHAVAFRRYAPQAGVPALTKPLSTPLAVGRRPVAELISLS